jgi:hypothetical protein
MLKSLTRVLLTGDHVLTNKEDELRALVAYAYDKVATESDALKLFTSDKSDNILRLGPGKLYVRSPRLPQADEEELDIDDQLGYPTARYIASFVSKDKGGIHVNEAHTLIRAYNAKVQAYFEALEAAGELDPEDA